MSISCALLCALLPAQQPDAIPPRPSLPELVTDRPDFTESTEVVGTGVFQFEMGFTIERENGRHSFTGPELLLRVGIGKRVELRFGGDGVQAEWARGESSAHGASDAEVAVKIQLLDQGRYRPSISLIPLLSLPTGNRYFSSNGYDPTLKLAWSKDLPGKFDVGGNLNLSALTAPEGRFRQTAASLSLGHKLVAGFNGYWEVFGFSPLEKGGSPAWIANTGLTHAVGKNAQVDVRVGRRITVHGPDLFFGAGVAFRQPTSLFVR